MMEIDFYWLIHGENWVFYCKAKIFVIIKVEGSCNQKLWRHSTMLYDWMVEKQSLLTYK